MAKRSNKRLSRSKKDNSGCMWGLISMFDFRHGHSNRKLLSDRKSRSSRHVGAGYSKRTLNLPSDSEEDHKSFDDVDKSGARRGDSGMASVKVLMEEEMARANLSKEIPSDELERIQSDFGIEIHLEKKSKKTRARIPVHDMKDSSSMETNQSNCPSTSEMTPFNFDLASFMLDFCANKRRYWEEHAGSKPLINLCPLETDIHTKNDYISDLDSELAYKYSILQKALDDVAEVTLSQKFVGARSPTDNRAIIQSKEFMDALDVLCSNKDLFLKLLQDPNSFLLKHIENLRNVQTGKPSETSKEEIGCSEEREDSIDHKLLHKQHGYSFFRRKDKSKETKPSKESDSSQALSRIVVLKPSSSERILNPLISTTPSSSLQSNCSSTYQEECGRHASHFSLKEIKRRLRHAVGESRKEWHLISMDAVLHKIPYGSKDSVEMGSRSPEHISKSSIFSKKRDKKSKVKDCQPSIEKEGFTADSYKTLSMTKASQPLDRESFLYEEARKRLVEMLESGEQKDILPNRHVSKPLGRILCLPEYNLLSPRVSPGRETLSPRERIYSPKQLFTQEVASSSSPQTVEGAPCIDGNPDDESQAVDSMLALGTKKQEAICIAEDFNTKGSTVTEDTEYDIIPVDHDHLDGPLELSCHEGKATSDSCTEEDSPAMLEVSSPEGDESHHMTPSVPASPFCLLIHKEVEDPESIMERSERPSPISVLEPLFTEEAISPERMSVDPAEIVVQPLQLHFGENDASAVVLTSQESEANLRNQVDEKEARFEYIRAVLESSGLCCDGQYERWHSSSQLLDPSLFDEVGISCSQFPDNPKLLFDCISEVIVEIQDKFFSCAPWITLVRTNMLRIPRGGVIVTEVSKRIDCCIQTKFPSTLDQIVGKDMEGGNWMDLRVETESIIFEMGDNILEYIMEETILELWD